jgi:starch synthase
MMALRYGTIPIVRATGGLADSIQTYRASAKGAKGNGFVFSEYSPAALLNTIRAAVKLYRRPAEWTQFVQQAAKSDFSWPRSAARYQALYCEALAARSAGFAPLALHQK